MITKSRSGVGAALDLTVGDVEFDYNSIVRLEVDLEDNMHDYASLEVAGLPPRAVTEYRGAPVRFLIDSGGSYSHEFVGRVEHVAPVSEASGGLVNGSPFGAATIHCYGASYAMRGDKSRVWERVSLAEMATSMADSYDFSVDVPETKLIKERFVQETESDWQALVRYAGEYGFRVTSHGAHLHVHNPRTAAHRNISFHKLTPVQTMPDGAIPSPGKIISFSGDFARESIDGEYKDAVVGVLSDDRTYDVRTSEVRGLEVDPLRAPIEERLAANVDSYAEARALIRRTHADRYDYRADVLCVGLAGCLPGGIVALDRYNASYDGLWYVHKVRHVVVDQQFTTQLSIVTNSGDRFEDGIVTDFTSPPNSVYKLGRWVSSKKVFNVYG